MSKRSSATAKLLRMTETSSADIPTPRKSQWYTPTPAKFLWAVLVTQGVLFLSVHYRWFWFNGRKGYTVLIAVTVTAIALLVLSGLVLASRFFTTKLQFSLATLFSTVLAMAIPLGWLGWEIDQARKQHAIVVSIHEKRGTVLYPDDSLRSSALAKGCSNLLNQVLGRDFFSDPRCVSMSRVRDEDIELVRGLDRLRYLQLENASLTHESLRKLQGFRELRVLHLSCSYNTPMGDTGFEQLRGLTELESLWLLGTDITDAGLVHIRGMKKLESLTVSVHRLSDQGLSHLAELDRIESLAIYGGRITDAGLAFIQKLSRLERLDLQSTDLTDAGVDSIKGFHNLRTLNLQGTKVTTDGARRLREALPNCHVMTSWLL